MRAEHEQKYPRTSNTLLILSETSLTFITNFPEENKMNDNNNVIYKYHLEMTDRFICSVFPLSADSVVACCDPTLVYRPQNCHVPLRLLLGGKFYSPLEFVGPVAEP